LPFEQLEPLDVGLCRSITPAQRQAGLDRLIVLSQALSKRTQWSRSQPLSVLKPSIQAVALQRSNHLDELVDLFGRCPNLFIHFL
jgi:hypothetical protein